MKLGMDNEVLSKNLRNQNRNGVADLAGHRIQTTEELEIIGECLNAGSFPYTDSAILFRMAEAAIRKTNASGS